MKKILDDLKSKCGVASATAEAYVRALVELNNDTPFLNVGFLKSTDAMGKLVGQHIPETQKALLTAIVSVLSLSKDVPTFKRVYQHYYRQLYPKKATEPTLTWEDVLKVKSSMTLDPYIRKKKLGDEERKGLMNYLVLSLYTDIPPRRNQDYMCMKVVNAYDDSKHTEDNYVCMTSGKMVFNKFKSRKATGAQTVIVPKELMDTIKLWVKLNKIPDLGQLLEVKTANGITRILNKVLGKKIGSGYLKTIYPKETTTG
jgi:hypothetical protein